MPEPLSILEAVDTCLHLTKALFDYAQDMKRFKKDFGDLTLNFGYDEIMLKKFIRYFHVYQERIDVEIRNHMTRLTGMLNERLTEIKTRINHRKNGGVLDYVVWPLVKSDLEKAEAKLGCWVLNINLVLSNLPEDLRKPLLELFANNDGKDYGRKGNPLSPLIAAEGMRKGINKSVDDQEFQDQLLKLRDDSVAGEVLEASVVSAAAAAKAAGIEPDHYAGVVVTKNDNRTTYFPPDLINVPMVYMHNKKENRNIELEVAKLVIILSHADTHKMHILRASKYFALAIPDNAAAIFEYGIIYEKPSDIACVVTLKDLIKHGVAENYSLTQILRLALELTSAISYIHAVGWVHESIRPQNILICYSKDDISKDSNMISRQPGVLNLCGFGSSRRMAPQVRSHGPDDGDWTTELYCHPERQRKTLVREEERRSSRLSGLSGSTTASNGQLELVRFEPQHDIYSLGVVLLELGLRKDLETLGLEPSNNNDHVDKRGTSHGSSEPSLKFAEPEDRKQMLKDTSATLLARRVGDPWKNIVVKCLEGESSQMTAEKIWAQIEELRI